MIYLESHSNTPAYNQAFEEFAFTKLAERDSIFILWVNKPCIVVGKNQNTVEEINAKFCADNDITIVRRLSGGGAVYQDLNNLNYTIITSEKETGLFDFKALSMPVIETLASMGVEAQFTGRNDLVIDNQKFCGNAQFIRHGRVMHHGCILFDVDLTVLSQALKVSADKIESKGKKSVRSRVTNIKPHLADQSLTIDDFINQLKSYMNKHYHMQDYELTPAELAEVLKIKAYRNDSWDWTYGKNPEFSIKRARRLSSGKVEALINVVDNRIQDLTFYGDFFGIKDVAELAEVLHDVKYDHKAISEALAGIEVGDYFMGITTEALVDILVD